MLICLAVNQHLSGLFSKVLIDDFFLPQLQTVPPFENGSFPLLNLKSKVPGD